MTRALLWIGCAMLLSACSSGCSDSDLVDTGPIRWDLAWSDEFGGAAGTAPSALNWDYDLGTGQNGWGNAELQSYTKSPSNVALDGKGNLVITARKETAGSASYTSARIKTRGKREQRYGRFEARIKLPRGQGIWPAFWMLGNDFGGGEVTWPDTGEIDIMEYRGQEPKVVHGSLHGPGYSGANAITKSYRRSDDKGFDEGFHLFAVEWDPGRIAWSVDDKVYNVISVAQVTSQGKWVYDHPFFILLNVAVGGGFVGSPDSSTVFPQQMLVDYVRVYQRRPGS